MEENKAIESEKQYTSFAQKSFFDKIIYLLKSIGGTVVYPNVLLFHVFKSGAVGFKQKMAIVGAFVYFIAPIDIIPDLIPGFGFADDVVALIAAVTALATCFNDEVQAAAKATLRRLLGDYDDRGVEALSKIFRTTNRATNIKTIVKKEPAQQPAQPTQERKIEIVDVEEVKPIEEAKS